MQKPKQTVYQHSRATRTDSQAPSGRFKTAKMVPVLAVPYHHSEAGVTRQTIRLQLEPVPRRLLNDVLANVVSVFVPMLAVDAFKNKDKPNPGNTEIYRDRLANGETTFGLEDEGEITRRLKHEPISIDGEKKVCENVRMSVIAGVNFLRQRKYVDAQIIEELEYDAVPPAILQDSALDRFNGVLQPEDRVNGAVQLGGQIPIKGVGRIPTNVASQPGPFTFVEQDGKEVTYEAYLANNSGQPFQYFMNADSETGVPKLYADFDEGANSLSLEQFYSAERMDNLTRMIAGMIKRDPHYGQKQALAIATGLSIETNKHPFVVYERNHSLNKDVQSAFDGPSLGDVSTDNSGEISFTVPIPKTEFGGMLVTFVSVLPDERLPNQPHPFTSKPWGAINHLAEELIIDPKPVIMRELNSEIDLADENKVAMYVGHNELYRNYINYGFNRHIGDNLIDQRSAVYQYDIPLSVNPENILYPEEGVNEYPFSPGAAPGNEVVSYTATSSSIIRTPIQFGPTPVEAYDVFDDERLFNDPQVTEEVEA